VIRHYDPPTLPIHHPSCRRAVATSHDTQLTNFLNDFMQFHGLHQHVWLAGRSYRSECVVC
jgi:hypothetical protein